MSFLVTIPHSGEKIPPQTPWLSELPEQILMCDVDRFVDVLYKPALSALAIPHVTTEWHRYAADLNRVPTDVNSSSVVGHPDTSRKYNRGFHWVNTTYKQQLMRSPMPVEDHNALVELVYAPFHAEIRSVYAKLRKEQQQLFALQHGKKKIISSNSSSSSFTPLRPIFHLDAHSMPSVGTTEHLDPHERRAEIVVSDCKGRSCDPLFRDLVIVAYTVAGGFKVGFNWPYFGGRLTQFYGSPSPTPTAESEKKREQQQTASASSAALLPATVYEPMLNQHVIQVEMNRSLYMNEVTKQLDVEKARKIQQKVQAALAYIQAGLPAVEAAIMKKQQQSRL